MSENTKNDGLEDLKPTDKQEGDVKGGGGSPSVPTKGSNKISSPIPKN